MNEHLRRTATGGLENLDEEGRQSYLRQRAVLEARHRESLSAQEQINTLQGEVADIKRLLLKLLEQKR